MSLVNVLMSQKWIGRAMKTLDQFDAKLNNSESLDGLVHLD